MQFTIIVPVYKSEPFLKKCVDSILAQTFSDFEVILVDDGSPDRSPEMCDEYAKQDPRVRVIHKPNGGLVSGRNAGIFAARGDYITYVDGDDWVRPNLLQVVHDCIEKSPKPLDMVVYAAEVVYTDHNEPLPNQAPEGLYDRERLEKEIFPYLIINRVKGYKGHIIEPSTWNKACRRELQLEYYVRDESIRSHEDIPMIYECMLNCQNIYVTNEPVYYYNKTNQNSILALVKENYLTKGFASLAVYFAERLKRYDPSFGRQWNDYLAHLVVWSCMTELRKQQSFGQAVKNIKEGIKTSGLVDCITLKGAMGNPNMATILLFKLGLYTPGMMICAAKVRIHAGRK